MLRASRFIISHPVTFLPFEFALALTHCAVKLEHLPLHQPLTPFIRTNRTSLEAKPISMID